MQRRGRTIEAKLSAHEAYIALSYDTLSRSDSAFIHQHIVDAQAAQTATETSKPLTVVFALVGLYLFLEKGYTGRQVQRAHMALARVRKTWPRFTPPHHTGDITAVDVAAVPAGGGRDAMISRWCRSVWDAWQEHHSVIENLVRNALNI